jgi:hypothetical protein
VRNETQVSCACLLRGVATVISAGRTGVSFNSGLIRTKKVRPRLAASAAILAHFHLLLWLSEASCFNSLERINDSKEREKACLLATCGFPKQMGPRCWICKKMRCSLQV